MSENSPSAWVVVVTMGDPVSHLGHKTSFGVFTSRTEAEGWSHSTYEGVNHIIDVIPLNQPFFLEENENHFEVKKGITKLKDINKEKK
tara:strand:+ start:1111 stop:1374 length:264 start_codon:yes stop_codon:yes gene_type:complete